MKQWLRQEKAVPWWVLLLIMLLTIVSFVLVQMKAHELHLNWYWAQLRLSELEYALEHPEPGIMSSRNPLGPPPMATIADFTEMKIGLLCSLGVAVGSGWYLFRGRRARKGNDSAG